MKVFNRVKVAKIEIKKILEDMQFMHEILQEMLIPIYEYEDNLQKIKDKKVASFK